MFPSHSSMAPCEAVYMHHEKIDDFKTNKYTNFHDFINEKGIT